MRYADATYLIKLLCTESNHTLSENVHRKLKREVLQNSFFRDFQTDSEDVVVNALRIEFEFQSSNCHY